ncbi:MAG: hypothetical protein HY399_08380 [Elusimicrobia bacterium]|nr:hypothetical protein [Elusimicrobiota bacterium]
MFSLLLTLFFAIPAGWGAETPFQTPPPNPAEVRAKIARCFQSDRACAEKLAEALLGLGQEQDILQIEGNADLTDLKQRLVLWAQEHPEAATDIFLSLKAQRTAFVQLVLKYWEMNPHRKRISYDDLLDSAQASAQLLSPKLAPENIQEISKKIFESAQVPEAEILPVESSEAPGALFSYPSFKDFSSLNWQIKTSQAEEIGRRASSLLAGLQRVWKWDRSKGHSPASLEKRQKQLEKTRRALEQFFLALQKVGGRNNVTEPEARAITQTLLQLRQDLILGYLWMKQDQLRFLAKQFHVPPEILKAYHHLEKELVSGKGPVETMENNLLQMEQKQPWLKNDRFLTDLSEWMHLIRNALGTRTLAAILDRVIVLAYPESEYTTHLVILYYAQKNLQETPVPYISLELLNKARTALLQVQQAHRANDLVQDMFYTNFFLPGVLPSFMESVTMYLK